VVAHRPADHLAGEQIEDHGQVEPALVAMQVMSANRPDWAGLR
jgi:hypothetical protein